MPSKRHTFTTHVEAGSPPETIGMVEAPGTAPGSVSLIPYAVYRHSPLPDTRNIRMPRVRCNNRGDRDVRTDLVPRHPLVLRLST